MSGYPKARWSVGENAVRLSVWTREIPEGSGGGYYLFTWARSSSVITLEELMEGTTQAERQNGKRSVYATLRTIPVPGSVQELDARAQEIAVARIMFAELRKFGGDLTWIPYGTDGKPVWFHEEVTKG